MRNGPKTCNLSVTSSTSVVQTTATNRKSDSTLNSLECWDYSVELECLRGPDGKPIFRLFVCLIRNLL